jgi:PAS domain S-box-containing protein
MPAQEIDKYVPDEGVRRALRAGRVVAWEWDLDTGYLALSDNAVDVLGWTSDVPSDFDERVHPGDQAYHQAALQRTLSEGVPYDVEIRFLRPDGIVMWLKDTGHMLTNSKGHRILSGATVDITAQKQMEEQIRASEERLRLTQKAVGVGLWEINLETERLALSPESLLMHGCSPDEPEQLASPRAWFARIHPDDRAKAQDVFERAMATGGLYDLIFRVPQEDGRLRWIHGLGRAISGSEGRPLRFVGLNIDVSARKEAEAEAQRKAATLEATLGNMDQGLLMFDEAGIVRVYNKRALELLDLPEELLASQPPFKAILAYQLGHDEFVRSDDGFRKWVAVSGFRNKPDVYERERPNGKVLEVRTIPLNDGGAVRTFTDITARRQAEAELTESEERYRTLVAASATIVWRANPDGLIVDASGWSEYTGQPAEEYQGHGWFNTVHPEDQDKSSAIWRGALASGTPFESEYRVKRHDGAFRWCIARGAPVKNPAGSVREWVGTLTDIHDQRGAAEQLRQAQKMEAVGQLTGGVAHDFNNLLTVILGNAEMLAEHLTDERLRPMAQMILQSAERGADLTRHLLAFGRRQSLNPAPVGLDAVVRQMLPLLQRATGEHIELRTEFSPSVLSALADRALLENALLNLVVNARDAMPQGGTLMIKTGVGLAGANAGQLPAGQEVVFVTVADTGTGMSPDVLERAFEPFFTTKEVGQGSGLGLAMVYGFAEQSGGRVEIESTEGKGTAVTILLRAVASEAEQNAVGMSTGIERGFERVLVVEDDPSVRAFVCSQVASLGYHVEAAASGPEALKMLEEGRDVDLLLTDVVLPQGMSGVELAQRARAKSAALKVLLTSGYSEEVFQHHGKPDERTLLLRKPYKLKELATTLRKALERSTS